MDQIWLKDTSPDASLLQQANLVKAAKSRFFIPKKRYSKSKYGCRTCKSRKIRCDETWPICNNCTKSARHCAGVSKPATAASSLEFAAPLTLSRFSSACTESLSDRDLLYFDLFRFRLVYGIVGHAPISSWKDQLLQAVHEEPALCHAAVAFAALSCAASDSGERCIRDKSPSSPSVDRSQLALQHYGKCIQSLREVFERGDSRSINVALLCALMCISFELRMEDPSVALQHLEHGLRVVEANKKAVDESVILAFSKLDLQAAVYLGRRPPVLDIEQKLTNRGGHGSLYQEADAALTAISARIFRFTRTTADGLRYGDVEEGIPLPEIIKVHDLQTQLERFHHAYLEPDGQLRSTTNKTLAIQISQLRINYLLSTISLATCLYSEEALYDRFIPDFLTIVDLAAEIIKHRQGPSGSRPDDIGFFSLDMGVIQPLYMTALKCRSSRIRRRAIALLETVQGSEGIYDRPVHAKIAQSVVQLEEEGLGLEASLLDATDVPAIPECRRIHSVDSRIQHASRDAIVYFRRRLNGMDGGWDDLMEYITY